MASIGSLTADLKLESAAFIRDLRRAADATAKNTSAMQRQMNGLQRSFSAAGAAFKGALVGLVSAATIRSINNLVQSAIQAGDEIGEAATKIGIGAEDLQRYRFAAAQADVETEKLDTALRMFAQNLAQGKISAEGNNMAEAFRNYIERIAEAPTQLEKVRIAQEAFGKQWQTAMLLAAQGAEEFKRQADSAFVVSARALEVASQLDNQFRAFGNAVSTGFQTGLLQEFGNGLSEDRARLEELNRAAEAFGTITARVFNLAIGSVTQLGTEISEVHRQTAGYVEVLKQYQEGKLGLLELGKGLMDPRPFMPGTGDGPNPFEDLRSSFDKYVEGLVLSEGPLTNTTNLINQNAAAIGEWKTKVEAAASAPAIFSEAWMNSMQSSIGQMQGFTSALGQESKTWFQINKAFAIAQAIMSTYEGAAKALGQLGAWGIPVAAGIVATGLAYVAMIAAQQPGGSSAKGSRGSGGGRRGGGGEGGGNGLGSAGSQSTLSIQILGDGFLSRKQLENVMEQIVDAQRDGAQILLSPT